MSETTSGAQNPPTDAEMASVMFAQLVMQQSNMAMIFLGRTPHPQTGKVAVDLDHARFFIDQLEMLDIKTRGNLDAHEQALLKQTLTTLRLAFVDAVSKPKSQPAPEKHALSAQPEPQATKATEQEKTAAEPAPEESHKKFTKKY